ncbi:MAG TPA: hypothetical protein VF297_00080 [Pyrinomonadaceae bacterium]
MGRSGRLEKLEAVAVAGVPCAWHALGSITPTLAGAEIYAGACMECGENMVYHSADATAQERELHSELYGPGATLATLTASRRSLAGMVWLSRRGTIITAAPSEVYKRALIEEHGRRMAEKWEAHWQTVSDEILETAVELLEGQHSDAELEEIIWPGGGGANPSPR